MDAIWRSKYKSYNVSQEKILLKNNVNCRISFESQVLNIKPQLNPTTLAVFQKINPESTAKEIIVEIEQPTKWPLEKRTMFR